MRVAREASLVGRVVGKRKGGTSDCGRWRLKSCCQRRGAGKMSRESVSLIIPVNRPGPPWSPASLAMARTAIQGPRSLTGRSGPHLNRVMQVPTDCDWLPVHCHFDNTFGQQARAALHLNVFLLCWCDCAMRVSPPRSRFFCQQLLNISILLSTVCPFSSCAFAPRPRMYRGAGGRVVQSGGRIRFGHLALLGSAAGGDELVVGDANRLSAVFAPRLLKSPLGFINSI